MYKRCTTSLGFLRLISLKTVIIRFKKDHSCQISRNFEHFLSFLKFLMQKQVFQQVCSTSNAMLLMGASICKKVYIFGINMKIYACLEMAEKF